MQIFEVDNVEMIEYLSYNKDIRRAMFNHIFAENKFIALAYDIFEKLISVIDNGEDIVLVKVFVSYDDKFISATYKKSDKKIRFIDHKISNESCIKLNIERYLNN